MLIRRSSLRHRAMTMIELLVVIAIILALAGLAAAFMPRVEDSTRLSSAIDQLEQWLLSAKMRAKRDGLATGIRLIQDVNDPGMYSQFQYIQQPDPLSGGTPLGNGNYNGGYCAPPTTTTAAGTTVNFPAPNTDFSLGGLPSTEWLVQPGDYLELRDAGGIHPITTVNSGTMLTISPYQPVTLSAPTANYRILRQPRILIGENPMQMPGNLAVDISLSYVAKGVSGYYEILFAPSGSVVGTNAGQSKIFLYVHDLTMTMNPADPSVTARSGIVAVQTLTGFIGAYNSGPLGSQASMYMYANEGRSSGL
jgi:prepilin-type N-terminal cleavage/methylation domain-containing protein